MDILAGTLELIGCWLVGNKKRICFIFFIVCGLCWVYVAFDKEVYGLLLVTVPNLGINLRNWFRWSKNAKN